MSLLHHILQPRWNVYYFNNNLKSTDEEHQISAIHKLNGRPKKISSLTHSLTHSLSPLRLPPSARHQTLFWAVRLTSCHVCCLSSNSSLLVRLQLCWDMLFLCFPCGFFLWLCIRLVSSVWTIHPQALCLMSFSTSRCFACLQSYSLHIRLPHQIRRMFLGLLLHEHLMPLPQSLGQPPSFRTIREHNLHISPREFHLDFNCQRLRPSNWSQHSKCCLAFSIRNWMSSSLPPFLLTMIPSNIWIRPSPRPAPLQWTRQYCVWNRYTLICRPAFAPCSLGPCLISHVLHSVCAKVGLDRGLLNISFKHFILNNFIQTRQKHR